MSQLKTYITVQDHTVSAEQFDLLHDEDLDMLITSPQPASDELARYYESEDYISHTDSKRSLFEQVYHVIRSISLKRKLRLIEQFIQDVDSEKCLLDVGCGTGDFLETAKNGGWIVTGVEPNPEARTIANRKTDNAIIDDNGLSGLGNNRFDVITLWHVLEHLPDFKSRLSEFHNLLKPDGILVVAVPNFKSYDAKHYGSFWAAYDAPRHLWHFSQNAISKVFREQGLKLINTQPLKFDSYYVSLLSEKYKTGTMNVLKAFWRGLLSNIKASRSGEYSSLIYIAKIGTKQF